jgi:hypothetical protein
MNSKLKLNEKIINSTIKEILKKEKIKVITIIDNYETNLYIDSKRNYIGLDKVNKSKILHLLRECIAGPFIPLNNTNVEITYNDDHVLIKRIYETYKK